MAEVAVYDFRDVLAFAAEGQEDVAVGGLCSKEVSRRFWRSVCNNLSA